MLALVTRSVLPIGFSSRQNRNAKSLEIIRSDVVIGSCGPLVDRQNLAVGARIECIAGSGGDERDIAADGRTLETRDRAQCGESLFDETLARWLIGIRRLRQGHESDPEIFGVEPNALPTQLHKTGDKQGGAREQSDRQRDLRAD